MRVAILCEESGVVRRAFREKGHKAFSIVEGREQRVHLMSPGPTRSRDRSETYQGIADAMADQWGSK